MDYAEARLGRILEFIGTPGTEQEIEEAVTYAAYENMKNRETMLASNSQSTRLRAGDKAYPDSFEARRAKVGGYCDYFLDSEVEAIN